MTRRQALALSALVLPGLLQAVMAPPLGWIFLHPIAWIPGLAVFGRLRGRRALLAGWVTGTIASLVVLYWIAPTIVDFAGLPLAAGVVALGLVAVPAGAYVAFFALGYTRVRKAAGSAWPIAVAAWFTACEFLSPELFSYGQGVGWWEHPRLFLVVSLTGVSGATFLVLLVNAVVLQALELRGPRLAPTFAAEAAASAAAPRPTRALARNSAILAALVLGAAAWSGHRESAIARAEASVEPLRVALVQPNYDLARETELLRQGLGATARDLIRLSEEALREDPEIDVLVWPEKVLPRSPDHPAHAPVRRLAARHGIEVWTGASYFGPAGDGTTRERNSAFRVDAGGRVDRRYDKNVLMPFGEYLPFEDRFPALLEISGRPRGYERGTEIPVYDAGPTRFAFLVCYEATLTRYVRRAVAGGADLLVNLTYDRWFGESSEPYLHLMLAAVQSAVHGVPLARATTTGISALVDARGVVTHRGGLFTREVVVGDVRPVRVRSPYGRFGDWFAWSCTIVSAALLAKGGGTSWANRITRRSKTARESAARRAAPEA